MGPQVLSDKRSNMVTGLGHGSRFNYDFVRRAKEQPGAGEYNQGGACGRQQLSSKKSLPLYSFGSATRDQAGKVYLTREHEKGQKGDSSPGPVTSGFVRFCSIQAAANCVLYCRHMLTWCCEASSAGVTTPHQRR